MFAPYLTSSVLEEKSVDKDLEPSGKKIYVKEYDINCSQLDYKADVVTDVLHRSIYNVIVYNSRIHISGKIPVTKKSIVAKENHFRIRVSDQKGFSNPSQLTFGGNTFDIRRTSDNLVSEVTFPADVKAGDMIDFSFSFDLKGTESLFFSSSRYGSTTLAISSSYPHPSFQGSVLPNTREVNKDGFNATWSVSEYSCPSNDNMGGVKFVVPANPYQQSMRSAKYGILIIILVFVASLFVEFLTRKEINPIQYAVIGLSLVLFYSLLVAFSEFIAFGVAYAIAASMTTAALMFYFRGILRNRSAYMLGGFVALVYALNYMLLQMESYALLAGSLVLFLLLCVVMYLTTDINSTRPIDKAE